MENNMTNTAQEAIWQFIKEMEAGTFMNGNNPVDNEKVNQWVSTRFDAQPDKGLEENKKINMPHSTTLSDEELIKKVTQWVYKLAETGGNAWTLSVPVRLNDDPDVLIIELCKRLKEAGASRSGCDAPTREEVKLFQPLHDPIKYAEFQVKKRKYFADLVQAAKDNKASTPDWASFKNGIDFYVDFQSESVKVDAPTATCVAKDGSCPLPEWKCYCSNKQYKQPTPTTAAGDKEDEIANMISFYAGHGWSLETFHAVVKKYLKTVLPAPQNAAGDNWISVVKECDDYLSETKYEKGKPIYLNSIGAGSVLHKKLKSLLPSPTATAGEQIKK